MARKTNMQVNGKDYYRITKTVGRKLNEHGVEVPVRKQFTGKSRKEAEEKVQQYFEQRKAGIRNPNQYFGILAEEYINTFFIHDHGTSYGTKENYLRAWRKHIEPSDLYTMPMEEVNAQTIQKIYNSLSCAPTTVESVHKLMRRFYKYAESEGYGKDCTATLVIPQVEKPPVENEIVVWTDEEIRTILKSFDKADNRFRLRFLLVLAYHTGCRVSELLGLKYSDFDTESMTLAIRRQVQYTKDLSKKDETEKKTAKLVDLKSTSSYRTLPLNQTVLDELERHKTWHEAEQHRRSYQTEFVFTTNSGRFYNDKNIRTAVFRYYERIGVPEKAIHTYRHTFGTNLCRKGVSIQTASQLLGHSDINMTAKYYVGIDFDEKQQAVQRLSEIIG